MTCNAGISSGKLNGRDDDDGTKGPTETVRLLAGSIARIGKTAREEAHAITREVLQERACDRDFRLTLHPALRHDALDELREVILDLRLGQQCRRPGTNAPELNVALDVLERIVQARLWATAQSGHERRDVLRVRHLDKWLAIERVGNGQGLRIRNPLAANQVLCLGR